MRSLLLLGTLSLSPVFEVVSQTPPVGDGSTVRSRPYVPTKYDCTFVRLVPLITALLAGSLGGALGYAFAVRGGAGGGVALGARPAEAPGLAQRRPESLAGVAEKVLPSVVTVRVVASSAMLVLVLNVHLRAARSVLPRELFSPMTRSGTSGSKF